MLMKDQLVRLRHVTAQIRTLYGHTACVGL